MARVFHHFKVGVCDTFMQSFGILERHHSIVGTAAPMDIGGRRMAGFALGVIDSFQYFGGSLAGYILGALLDKNLGNYFYFMAPFGAIGGYGATIHMQDQDHIR